MTDLVTFAANMVGKYSHNQDTLHATFDWVYGSALQHLGSVWVYFCAITSIIDDGSSCSLLGSVGAEKKL